MSGLIGKKIGMTSIFGEDGSSIPCTAIEVGPCRVTQVKSMEKDAYEALQLGFGDKKEKRTSRAQKGHFKAAGTDPMRHLVEFPMSVKADAATGDEIRVEDVFEEGDLVHVSGTSKGKGFQGVVKRWGFGGVGMVHHGQHNRQRHPGSIGQASDPSRVFKGIKMAGRMGGKRVKVKDLTVVRILPENNIMLVKGAVPGPKNGILRIDRVNERLLTESAE